MGKEVVGVTGYIALDGMVCTVRTEGSSLEARRGLLAVMKVLAEHGGRLADGGGAFSVPEVLIFAGACEFEFAEAHQGS